MSKPNRRYRFLLSGGGTGGHIYPAIAIANGLKEALPNAEITFVGAKTRMEMKKVPEAGYPIIGLRISGFQRNHIMKNLKIPFQLLSSLWKCYWILKKKKPAIVIGTGGYASAPLGIVATWLGIPLVLQEQNAIPGITNKWLGKRASKIFVGYQQAKPFFPKGKSIHTGNPIRSNIKHKNISSKEAKIQLGLDPNKKMVLSIGGSQGSRTINRAWKHRIDHWEKTPYQLFWQTGIYYYRSIANSVSDPSIFVVGFIQKMHLAYQAADLIVSRAGALAISELCLVGKPCILVPFPFAAEDHQTKNAQALVEKNAVVMIPDRELKTRLLQEVVSVLENKELSALLSNNIKRLGKPNATDEIVKHIIKLAGHAKE